MTNDTDTHYYFQDALGSVRNVVESDEDVANAFRKYHDRSESSATDRHVNQKGNAFGRQLLKAWGFWGTSVQTWTEENLGNQND